MDIFFKKYWIKILRIFEQTMEKISDSALQAYRSKT
jgi:hypothetical protein